MDCTHTLLFALLSAAYDGVDYRLHTSPKKGKASLDYNYFLGFRAEYFGF